MITNSDICPGNQFATKLPVSQGTSCQRRKFQISSHAFFLKKCWTKILLKGRTEFVQAGPSCCILGLFFAFTSKVELIDYAVNGVIWWVPAWWKSHIGNCEDTWGNQTLKMPLPRGVVHSSQTAMQNIILMFVGKWVFKFQTWHFFTAVWHRVNFYASSTHNKKQVIHLCLFFFY